jgi:predicted restriction endonuclease
MSRFGRVKLSHVEIALQELGGKGTWVEILSQVTKNRNGDYSHYLDRRNYEETTRQLIQQHCPYYRKYKGPTRFEKMERGGFWLIDNETAADQIQTEPTTIKPQSTPIAIDIEETNQPERVKQETYRILRDTILAREVKESNKYKCHFCGQILKLNDERSYAEAHHVKPLGAPHDGPDVRENILCVCPNHHVLLDYGAIKLDRRQLTSIAGEYIDYHNEHIFGKK